MNWEELKEKAKEMGAEVYTDVIYYSNLCFWEFGDVETQGTTFSVDDKTIAERRTPDQMLAIMKALQQEVENERQIQIQGFLPQPIRRRRL